VAQKRFVGQGGGRKYKIIKFHFYPKIAKHLHQPKIFNGSRVFAHSLFIESKREPAGGGEHSAFGDFGDVYYQNNPFLGMFQKKFCLKTFETCSLLFISVLKSSILAISLFEYLLLDPSAKRGLKLSRAPCTLLFRA